MVHKKANINLNGHVKLESPVHSKIANNVDIHVTDVDAFVLLGLIYCTYVYRQLKLQHDNIFNRHGNIFNRHGNVSNAVLAQMQQ